MSVHFRTLTLSDYALVRQYVTLSSHRNCDLSFVNLFAWQTLYQTEIAEWGGFLLFRFHTDGHLAYLMPIGEGDMCAVLELLREDACNLSHPFLLLGVHEHALPLVKDCMGESLRLNENRDHADYIYSREALATLSGKKLQPKRNHVNRFIRQYPQYEYRALGPEDVPACMELARQWAEGHSEEAERRGIEAEEQALTRALAFMEELDIIGGTLWIEGKLVAFTYGGAINENTFDVCVEKADVSYEGAYAMINKEFVASLPEQYVYINREEDLGIEGLRKAKLSYQPAELLTKYSAWSACTLSDKKSEWGLTPEDLHIKWQTRALWKLCFGDAESFIQLYFTYKYTPRINNCIVNERRVISALQRIPYVMSLWDMEVPVSYVSGACTHPEFRGKGYMRDLLRQAHQDMYKEGRWFSVLIPASESLFGYYARSGYYTCLPPWHTVADTEEKSDKDAKVDVTSYARYDCGWLKEVQMYLYGKMKLIPGALLHDEEDMQVVVKDLCMAGGRVVVARSGQGCVGVWMGVPEDGAVRVVECFAESQEIRERMLKEAITSWEMPESSSVYQSVNKSQLRIIDVYKVLKRVAECRPEMSVKLYVVGDEDIPENNGAYLLKAGECVRESLPKKLDDADKTSLLDIAALAGWLFREHGPYLSMMLN